MSVSATMGAKALRDFIAPVLRLDLETVEFEASDQGLRAHMISKGGIISVATALGKGAFSKIDAKEPVLFQLNAKKTRTALRSLPASGEIRLSGGREDDGYASSLVIDFEHRITLRCNRVNITKRNLPQFKHEVSITTKLKPVLDYIRILSEQGIVVLMVTYDPEIGFVFTGRSGPVAVDWELKPDRFTANGANSAFDRCLFTPSVIQEFVTASALDGEEASIRLGAHKPMDLRATYAEGHGSYHLLVAPRVEED
jgi:hypothetical protein